MSRTFRLTDAAETQLMAFSEAYSLKQTYVLSEAMRLLTALHHAGRLVPAFAPEGIVFSVTNPVSASAAPATQTEQNAPSAPAPVTAVTAQPVSKVTQPVVMPPFGHPGNPWYDDGSDLIPVKPAAPAPAPAQGIIDHYGFPLNPALEQPKPRGERIKHETYLLEKGIDLRISELINVGYNVRNYNLLGMVNYVEYMVDSAKESGKPLPSPEDMVEAWRENGDFMT